MFSVIKGHEGYHFNEMTGNWDFIDGDAWVFAKVFKKNKAGTIMSTPAMLPSKFNLDSVYNPDNLEDTLKLIDKLSKDPSLVAIRAIKATEGEPFKRNKVNFSSNEASHIIAMDIDSVPLPENLDDSLDLTEWMDYILDCFVELRPEVFTKDLGYIIHASSSAGLKKGVRMHVLFRSNIPLKQSQLKYFFNEVNIDSRNKFRFEIADLNYYSATQPHFFADPIFMDDIEDPFKDMTRLVYREGSSCNMPDNLPDFMSKRAEVSKKDHKYFDLVSGKQNLPKFMVPLLEELQSVQDGVYLRLLPKIYHKAWQAGVDIKWLEKQIYPIIEGYLKANDKPNRNVQQYLDNGRAEALRVFLGESRRLIPGQVEGVKITTLPTASEDEDIYLKIKELPPAGSITFIKASLGTGKTTAVSNWIKEGVIKGNFLAVTNTKSLVSSNAEKFNSGQYNNKVEEMDFCSPRLTKMSTTIHSLHKFASKVSKIDFLFIDECDAVMNDILFSPIIKNRRECLDTLQAIMFNAKNVILSDGDISEETISAYGSLIGFSKPLNSINHSREMLVGVDATEVCDIESMWALMKCSLDTDEKCILVSDCSPDELNERGLLLRQQTGKVIKEIHSSSTDDVDIRRILDLTNEELIAQDISGLLCSPSVTSGVDFNYFDNVFVITLSNNHTPNLRFQALRRDRGAKHIYYYTAPTTKGFITGARETKLSAGWQETCQQRFALRREVESKNFQNTFRYYLMEQGCTISIVPDPFDPMEKTDDTYMAQRVNAIMQASMLYTPPRHNDAFAVKESIKYYYSLDEVVEEDIIKFLTDRPDKCADFFHKLYPKFWSSIKRCQNGFQPFIEAIAANKREFYIATGCSADVKHYKFYLQRAGIKEPGEYTRIIQWYRLYCLENSIVIPKEFLSPSELEKRKQSELELI